MRRLKKVNQFTPEPMRGSKRSSRGGAAAAVAPGRPPASTASTDDVSDTCSVERSSALEFDETTREARDRGGKHAPPVSGLGYRNVRRGIRKSIIGARTYHRGMATRSTLRPERARPPEDRFLEFVGALRDWIKCIGRDATWRFALAGVFACVSTQLPLPNDTAFARALLFISTVSLGALTGRRLDRRKRRNRDPLGWT